MSTSVAHNLGFPRGLAWRERTHKAKDQVKYAMNIEMSIDIEIMTE